MRRFKYANFFEELEEDCPPAHARERARHAFHFVFDPSSDDRNFKVYATRRPAQFEADPCCSQCGLSMFTTEQLARAKFAKVAEKSKNIRKLLGDHLALLVLTEDHGIQTNATAEGHFDLHEYHDVNLASVATVIGPL